RRGDVGEERVVAVALVEHQEGPVPLEPPRPDHGGRGERLHRYASGGADVEPLLDGHRVELRMNQLAEGNLDVTWRGERELAPQCAEAPRLGLALKLVERRLDLGLR